MKKPVLEFQNLAIGYATAQHILAEDISAALQAGELVCLIGPNGVGKSTLIRTLAGMQKPLAGQVRLLGESIYQMKPQDIARRLGVVLTDRIEMGLLSGYELVALGRHPHTNWLDRLSAEDEAVVFRALQMVGAEKLASRKVYTLSDGERQKMMIARALAQEPDVVLLDEPTAYLDLPRRVELMQLLRQLARTTRRAILLSTHDLDLALRTADRIWLMQSGGQFHSGAPEDLVLNGAFEATFHSEGVGFDLRTGTFKLHTQAAVCISVVGQGVPLHWTQHALEREGFTLATNGTDSFAHIEIQSHGEVTRWVLQLDETTETHESLYDLLAALRMIEDDAIM